MGFLKKSKVPNELPDLAIGAGNNTTQTTTNTQTTSVNTTTPAPTPTAPQTTIPTQPATPSAPQTTTPITPTNTTPTPTTTPIQRQEQEQPNLPLPNNIPETPQPILTTTPTAPQTTIPTPTQQPPIEKTDLHQELNLTEQEDPESFIDSVLEDINGEIQDIKKLEEWYENKFLPQDVVSNMRTYWEDNKAEMIIKSFGSEYKTKINKHGRKLQELEGDWREIYFKLIKKEEEMKKEERILKETLSEFVELCKRRKENDKEKNNKENKKEETK